MTTLSLELKDADRPQIQIWVEYLRSLDFVQTIKEKEVAIAAPAHLLVEDIRQFYPNEWVLLADTDRKSVV